MIKIATLLGFAISIASWSAQAQVPNLPEVPTGLAARISAVLSEHRRDLVQRLSSAQAAAATLREDCSGIARGTPQAEKCRSRQGQLIILRSEYSKDVIEFGDNIRLASGGEKEPLDAIAIFGLKIRGKVTLYNQGSPSRKRGMFLAKADRITTGPNSRFEGALPDGTLIVIGPNSDIEISTYNFNLRKNEIFLRKIKGVLRSIVTLGSSQRFQVRTSKACACVRGTDFVIQGSENAEIGSVAVLEGEVNIEGPMQPLPVSVSAGQVVYLRDDGAVESINDVGEVILLQDILQRYPELAKEQDRS